MSRSSVTSLRHVNRIVSPGLMSFFICLLIPFAVYGQPGETTAVKIQLIEGVPFGANVEVSVDLEQVYPGMEMGGFDFLIVYDLTGLTLTDVNPGQLLVDCGWEYFTYRHGPLGDCGDSTCPEGVVRIVALAETNNGPIHPSCFADTSGQLFKLDFLTTSNPDYLCYFLPIRFYWYDCGDNVFADVSGDTLLLSDRVIDITGMDITEDYPFPTWYGAPNECVVDSTTIRKIDFYNGGIWLTCDDTIGTDGAIVKVDKVSDAWLGDNVDVGINLFDISPDLSFAGFDLLLQYDASALIFQQAVAGQLLTDCEWEYFIYRSGSAGDCGGFPCPDNLIRLVAIAETNNGNIHPSCFADQPGELAVLTFQVSNDSSFMCQTYQITWMWYDCGDNVMADPSGDTLYLSQDVFDYYGFPITQDTLFPTPYGAPNECIPVDSNDIVRTVDYFPGGIRVACGHFIDYRGDINLNGISYEIADWVMFTNYFLLGLEAFTIDPDLQVAATDINADGLTLTLQDFIYLYRIINGLAVPYDTSYTAGMDTVVFEQDLAARTVSFSDVDSLAAVLLTFNGEIVPSLLVNDSGFTWWYDFDGVFTRFMIYPTLLEPFAQPGLYPGPILSYTGSGTLEQVEVADYLDTYFIETISITGQPAETRIRTEVQGPVPFGYTVNIAINLENTAPGFEMGGFDFLLGYDANALLFQSASSGQLLDTCGWEYFTYRTATDSCTGEPCPSGMLRIVAIADISNGDIHPSCYGDSPGQLAVMSFQVTTNHAYECQFTPIDWFWMDCGDNSVATVNGDSLYVSHDVYSPGGIIITQDTTFPTYLGAPDECINGMPGFGIRYIDFYNGGVDIVCPDSLDIRGDLNLDGLQHTIADYTLFSSYFLYGLSVFTINIEAQVAASDVNADGLVLTFQDLIYLYRIMIGDALPFPSPPKQALDTAILIQDTATNKVALAYPDSLSALYLVFSGNIEPTFNLPEHDGTYASHPSQTLVLILPSLSGSEIPTLASGELFSYTGEGQLVAAYATYNGLSPIPTSTQLGNITCCINRGNADGIMGPSGPIDVADLSYLVSYLFKDGPVPPCFEEGNVDGLVGPGGLIDVSDLTYLVDYLFKQGPPPPPCW